MAFDTILTDKTGLNGIPQYYDSTGAPKPLIGDKGPYSQVVDVNGTVLFTAANPGRTSLTASIPAGTNSIGSVQITDGVAPAAFLTPANPGNVQLAANNISLITASAATGVSAIKAVGIFKTYVFEAWGNGTFNMQIQAVGPSGIARNLKVWDELAGAFVTGNYNITASGFYSVSVPPFINIQANVIGNAGIAEVNSLAVTAAPTAAGNVTVTLDGVATNVLVVTGTAEVESLTVSAGPTASGNVTVTLNGVAANVAVSAGVAEVDTLTVTAAATAAGNVTVTLNGTATNVAILATDTIAQIHDKVRATTFTGWTTGGAAGAAVTFTSTTAGTRTAPVYSAAATGAAGNIVVTTAGVNADTTAQVATKIAAASYTGWTASAAAAVVTFTATAVGVKTAPSYSAGTTGATAAMSTPTAGVNADDATSVATKVRNTAYATWTTGGTGTTVTFTSTTTGLRADGIYSPGTTGAAGTMTTTTQGAAPSLSVVGGLMQ